MARTSHSTSPNDDRADAPDDSRDHYERTRRDFEEMSFEQQASFLVESTASALARGLEHAGRSLADELERLFRKGRKPSSERNRNGEPSPGPAEPETSQRSAPRG